MATLADLKHLLMGEWRACGLKLSVLSLLRKETHRWTLWKLWILLCCKVGAGGRFLEWHLRWGWK